MKTEITITLTLMFNQDIDGREQAILQDVASGIILQQSTEGITEDFVTISMIHTDDGSGHYHTVVL